jgi:tetratricopeptide (TPR) repeat protein
LIRKKVKENPKSHEALSELGDFLRNMKRYREAKKVMKRALKFAPRDKDGASTWTMMGLVLRDAGDYDAAEHHFLTALNLHEKNHEAMYYLGELYKRMLRYEESKEAFEKAIEMKPEFIDTWVGLGVALAFLNRLEECFDILQNTVNIAPNRSKPRLVLGAFLTDLQRFDEAISAIKEAIKIEPESWEAWETLGYIYGEQGKLKESADCYRKAREFGAFERGDGEFYNPFQEDE